jgi:imidazoleglycerol-phosphate dehydratase
MTTIERLTNETQVTVTTTVAGDARIDTSVPFLDHMLRTLSRYAVLPLSVTAQGDLRHHIVEDVAITVGDWVRQRVSAGAARYADRAVVMDDAWVRCAVDVGGRAHYEGPLPSTLYDHWMRSFAMNAACTLHLRVDRGRDRHHVIEAAFKALGLCLREALADAAGAGDVNGRTFSTKGAVTLRRV